MRSLIRLLLALCALVGALVIVTAIVAVAAVLRNGVSARVPPTAFETALARGIRDWSVPRAVRREENPVPVDDEVLTSGRRHFADHCAGCHANDGSGDTPIGRTMFPRAPDMRSAGTQSLSDGQLFYFIEHGIRLTGMPAFGTGSAESERASWELVHFIRHLPSITEAELEEMRQLNPKSPAEWQAEEEMRQFLGQPAPAPDPHAGHRD